MEENEYEENKYKMDVFLCFDVQKNIHVDMVDYK